jgi:zinc transport system permease protein
MGKPMINLSSQIMQNALLGVMITGLTAPSLGIYLVQRRMSLIGDGIGHIALTGVGLGLLTGTQPVLTAVIVAIIGSIAVELVRSRGKTSGDIALAMLFYGGISGGVFLVSLAHGKSNTNLMAYLFGSPLTTSRSDLAVMAVLGACVLVVTLGLRPWLFAICQDEEYAKVSGLPVRVLNILLATMTAVTVTVAMRAVGLLLVSALMVVPVATAQLLSRGFKGTMALAMLGGLVSGVAGFFLSVQLDSGTGATVVITAIALFVLVVLISPVLRRRLRPRSGNGAGEAHDWVIDS